jgi:hypothetical protein
MGHRNAVTIKGSLSFIVFMSERLLSLRPASIIEDTGLIEDKKNPNDYVRVVRWRELPGEDRL